MAAFAASSSLLTDAWLSQIQSEYTALPNELTVPLPTSKRRRAKLQRSVSERSDSDSSGIADIDTKSQNDRVSCAPLRFVALIVVCSVKRFVQICSVLGSQPIRQGCHLTPASTGRDGV